MGNVVHYFGNVVHYFEKVLLIFDPILGLWKSLGELNIDGT